MNEASSLSSATERLQQHDAYLTSIDLRGRGRVDDGGTSDTSSDATDDSKSSVPRKKIIRFIAAIKQYSRPPPSLQPSQSCQLENLALHNHFLDPCELEVLFAKALPTLCSLRCLVLFFHDVGDRGVDLLMKALTGRSINNGQSLGCSEGGNTSQSQANLEVSSGRNCPPTPTTQLKELYLSHCNISCKGAATIAKALNHASSYSSLGINGNKLKGLQVLSLGSNRIGADGARLLAEAFGRYPSLQRMVLHGNQGVASSSASETTKPLFCHALSPSGWQQQTLAPTPSEPDLFDSIATATPTAVAMSIFAPLILPHIQRRWEKDTVLVRPYDVLRQRLHEEMYRKYSTFIDFNLEVVPDVLAWIGRAGLCCKQTSSLHSQTFRLHGKIMRHSTGCEQCRACATIHLNDLHELFLRMPHIMAWFKCLSAPSCSVRRSSDL